jgi:plastocyanin
MTRRLPIALAGSIAAAVALAAPASAGLPTQISVNDDFFDPEKTGVSFGTDVHWQSAGGGTTQAHTVTQDRRLFGSGSPSNNIDLQIGPSAGTCPFYCEVHGGKGGTGMSGVLKVKPDIGSTLRHAKRRGNAAPIVWSDSADESGDQFDVRYKVSGKRGWNTWLKNTDQDGADFGAGDPVNLKPDKTYSIQVRSELSSNPKRKHSGWSPSLKITLN